jgi:cytochrome bd-type quinol oxidase subunit 1
MQSRLAWAGDVLILAWEGLISHTSPVGVLTAVMVFNSVMAYSLCRTATRRQLTTLYVFQSVLLLVWILGVVVMHETGAS